MKFIFKWIARFLKKVDFMFQMFATYNIFATQYGGLAQLARALAWHARGHRFDSDILHLIIRALRKSARPFLFLIKL
ncbi:MAG: hypothetical protein JWQ57_3759 [Mucilaginibacter sp.]|nr:hypothetical protein [Mucilaginibacter sp.]